MLELVVSNENVSEYQPVIAKCPCCNIEVAQDIVTEAEYHSFFDIEIEVISQSYTCRITGCQWQSEQMAQDYIDDLDEVNRMIDARKRSLNILGER